VTPKPLLCRAVVEPWRRPRPSRWPQDIAASPSLSLPLCAMEQQRTVGLGSVAYKASSINAHSTKSLAQGLGALGEWPWGTLGLQSPI
jgi:hypothetical protein